MKPFRKDPFSERCHHGPENPVPDYAGVQADLNLVLAYIFADQRYKAHFVPYIRNKVGFVSLACEDVSHMA